MADRKVINKYYPPDFDPSKIGRAPKKDKSGSAALPTVRLMSPFSMRCTTCGEYIHKGKKFNARKEDTGESYLGIKIIRFHIRCPRCSSVIKFKTDPKSSDYTTELGAVRNYEQKKDKEQSEETLEDRLDRIEREENEEKEREKNKKSDLSLPTAGSNFRNNNGNGENDPLENLASQVEATRREIAMNEELEDLYQKNKVIEVKSQQLISGEGVDLLQKMSPRLQQTAEEKEEEELAKEIFRARRQKVSIGNDSRISLSPAGGPTSTTNKIGSGFSSKIIKKKKQVGKVRIV